MTNVHQLTYIQKNNRTHIINNQSNCISFTNEGRCAHYHYERWTTMLNQPWSSSAIKKKIRLMNNQPIATLKNLLKQQDLILAELLGFYLSMFIMLWWVVANWLIFCIWLQGASFCNFMKKYPTECLNVMKSHTFSIFCKIWIIC